MGMSQEYRHILRIMGTDVQGTLKTVYALTGIKGISLSLSNAVLKKAGINPDVRVGFLTETELDKIEEIIKDPTRYGLPSWLFNKRKNAETGKDVHLISADLLLRTKTDVDQEKAIRSWRGYRHAYGLKVRGQRTKTTGRAGKALGVKKKTVQQKSGGS
ncbi:30S ribosomal protein S13 [Candidatus Bathyarchaeota archaeon]|nr:30S ribosomal protein S13 [Candidatus Bathyarchaeota archaeon]